MTHNPHEADLVAFYNTEVDSRAQRPLGDSREQILAQFIAVCDAASLQDVLEIGCGAGRDGEVLARSFTYTGIDVTPASVEQCRSLGLHAVVAGAQNLPFGEDSFDAVFSMSTFMHLPDDVCNAALLQVRRVLRAGGIFEIGVWGHETDRDWTSQDGRYFRHRSEATLRGELAKVGRVEDFRVVSDGSQQRGTYHVARVRRS